MILLVIIGLVFVILCLIVYNLRIRKKITELNSTNDMIDNLRIVQDFIDTIGKESLAEDKISIINDLLTEKFNIKYSTIVTFNGAEYVIKASNVEEKYLEKLKDLQRQDTFQDSILTATPKYVTVNKADEKLTYQMDGFNRAKSAMFFPLYIDNVYIGYWIIESDQMHAFDNIDTNILGIIRDNIIAVIKSISYQNTIENIYRIDKTTNLFSAEYLYGKGKLLIDKHSQSTMCMINIINIDDINNTYGRNIGTEIILKMTNLVKTKMSSQYIFVRYMGPKFAIVFPGVDMSGIADFLDMLKKAIETIKLEITSKSKKKNNKIIVTPKVNIVLSTYYKGTGMEEVAKKLEEYLDNADKKESNINCI